MTNTRDALKNSLSLDNKEIDTQNVSQEDAQNPQSKPKEKTEAMEYTDENNGVDVSVSATGDIPDEVDESIKKNKTEDSEENTDEEVVEKRSIGRPVALHKVTKLHKFLVSKGISRSELFGLILDKYPDEPVSPDALSRIISGKREHYSTHTLFRICGALKATPNQILDYKQS